MMCRQRISCMICFYGFIHKLLNIRILYML